MWSEEKQRRFDDLRRDDIEYLTPDKRQELDRLLAELEHEEWEMLRPALERLRQEEADLQVALGVAQTQEAMLKALADRYADLVARSHLQLTVLVREHEVLRAEYERVLG